MNPMKRFFHLSLSLGALLLLGTLSACTQHQAKPTRPTTGDSNLLARYQWRQ